MGKQYTRLLTIAGSDSGGGAGIQADLKTFSALKCYGASVITALTAQNTMGVKSIHGVPPKFIGEQIDAVLEDIGADAVKIGMLHSSEVIEVVADRLKAHQVNKVVLDPVMVAKSGDKLLEDEAIESLKSLLLPLSTLITPNIPEAEVLLGTKINQEDQIEDACRQLVEFGCRATLIKGGHTQKEDSDDLLYIKEKDQLIRFKGKRVETKNTHGTGCTLSSAIASRLGQGYELENAVREAKSYIQGALEEGAEYQLGKGAGPVFHFYNLWKPVI